MKIVKEIYSFKRLKKGVILTLKITFIIGVSFFVLGGNYSTYNFILSIVISAVYSFLLGFGSGLLNDYLNTKWNWITQTNQRVWAGIIATILYTVPMILLVHYILFIKVQGMKPENFFSERGIWIHLFWIIFAFGVSAFLHAREFMRAWKKSVQQETVEHKIVAKTESAKFETLKSQIDPHFLFNSLNVLTSLIGENPNQAERFTTKLSKVYRYVLEQRNKELVPIEEELQFAKTYMELLKMRFEDAVLFEIPQTISNPDLKIVPLSLQLLLENAVKHNVVSPVKPLTIRIFEQNGFLQVENNKNLKEAIGKKSTKVGLRNIVDRYGFITQKNVLITDNNKIFAVSLPLLKNPENNMEIKKTPKLVEERAKEYVTELKAFYLHLIKYLIFCSFIIFINLKFSPKFHWFWFAIIGWGIGIILRALRTFQIPLFDKKWEEERIKKYIEKNK